MVRSMYSGVSGLRSHQTRMDTIGNNIANVNTYGFKSGRTTFRDIYYQQMSSASEPTAAIGGTNPSAVGYGGKVGSVDLMMGRSTFTMTDNTMDMAIDGDGFFQVQDAGGNTYYTRAGMLGFDAAGNLVDMQGNFVLGINGDPTGKPAGSERIQISLPVVQPTAASVTQPINGVDWTLSATNPTIDGNLNFNFMAESSLTDGMVVAEITTSGITIKMHPDNSYGSLGDLNAAVNAAITQANNNTPHVAGDFTLSAGAGQDPFAAGPLTAAELCSSDYKVKLGSANLSGVYFGGVTTSGVVGNEFSASGATPPQTLDCIYQQGPPSQFRVTMEVGGQTYVGVVEESRSTAGRFNLYNTNGNANDFIEMKRPSFGTIMDEWSRQYGAPATAATADVTLGAAAAVPGTVTVLGVPVALDAADTTVDQQAAKIAAALNNAAASPWKAVAGAGGVLHLTAKTAGLAGQPTAPAAGDFAAYTGATVGAMVNGTDAVTITPNVSYDGTPHNIDTVTATASAPSTSVGLGGTSLPLRGGTAGGPQTLADMTGIYIGTNGVILGYDSQGTEIIVGRIDLATFANPEGLNQAGSSNYTVSANSGDPILNQPGTGGAGSLVGGSLELSNADLSREFSDMITTQRGYQANSRIITVSDTMLEELINLKR